MTESEVHTTIAPSGGRGCGDRKEGAVYACCGVGGMTPWQNFLLDPTFPVHCEPFRGIQYAEDIAPDLVNSEVANETGVVVLVDYVGKKYYPTVPDFMEEFRRFGMSRNWGGFDFSRLAGRKPILILLHSRAVWDWDFDDSAGYPHINGLDKSGHATMKFCQKSDQAEHYPVCTFHLWPMALQFHTPNSAGRIERPWGVYHPFGVIKNGSQFTSDEMRQMYPQAANWRLGAFAIIPITHIETIKRLESPNATQAGLPIVTMEK